MVKVQLNPFVDFAAAGGTAKVTAVASVQKRANTRYRPGSDYYKEIREGAAAGYRSGNLAEVMADVVEGARTDQAGDTRTRFLSDGFRL